MRALATIAIGIFSLGSHQASALDGLEAPAQELRVLTYNIWGIPLITPSKSARVAKMAKTIADLDPHLIALQEVWIEEDAQRLIREFHGMGWRHSHRPPTESGLLIISKYPLRDPQFVRYRAGQYPHNPLHVDWMADKGLGLVQVLTPMGPLEFGCTHLQAGYGTQDYLFVQTSQALQAADAVQKRNPSAPMILAGDLNSAFSGLPFRLLSVAGRLRPVDPKSDIDAILHRSGENLGFIVRHVRSVLTEPIALDDGTVQPLSDHPGVLAIMKMRRCQSCGLAWAPPWKKVATEASVLAAAERNHLKGRMRRDQILGALLPVALLGALVVLRPRRRRTVMLSAGALAAAGWFLYLGLSYAPAHIASLEQIQRRVDASSASRDASPEPMGAAVPGPSGLPGTHAPNDPQLERSQIPSPDGKGSQSSGVALVPSAPRAPGEP